MTSPASQAKKDSKLLAEEMENGDVDEEKYDHDGTRTHNLHLVAKTGK